MDRRTSGFESVEHCASELGILGIAKMEHQALRVWNTGLERMEHWAKRTENVGLRVCGTLGFKSIKHLVSSMEHQVLKA